MSTFGVVTVAAGGGAMMFAVGFAAGWEAGWRQCRSVWAPKDKRPKTGT